MFGSEVYITTKHLSMQHIGGELKNTNWIELRQAPITHITHNTPNKQTCLTTEQQKHQNMFDPG